VKQHALDLSVQQAYPELGLIPVKDVARIGRNDCPCRGASREILRGLRAVQDDRLPEMIEYRQLRQLQFLSFRGMWV
jgi:hypothetical protein